MVLQQASLLLALINMFLKFGSDIKGPDLLYPGQVINKILFFLLYILNLQTSTISCNKSNTRDSVLIMNHFNRSTNTKKGVVIRHVAVYF